MKKKKSKKCFLLIILFMYVAFSAGGALSMPQLQKAANLLVDANATEETQNLFINLIELSKTGLMFGHQDDLAYGIGWWAQSGRSDIKEVCGSYPAVYGWEIGHIELGRQQNLDRVNFDQMLNWIKQGYERGGIITISWHSTNPLTGGSAWDTTPAVSFILPGGSRHEIFKSRLNRVADFLASLKTNDGTFIPIIFRPYHEHSGSWFWWGQNLCTKQEYIKLWQFTVEYLRDIKGLHHLLYAYSPSSFGNVNNYLDRYPGDDFVDILGLDDYNSFSSGNYGYGLQMLRVIVDLAEAKDKVAALTELGLDLKNNNCWTNFLNPVKNNSTAKKIAWILVWRNANTDHFFAPYPGHPTVPDFANFFNDPFTVFEDDLPDVYSLSSNDSTAPVFLKLPEQSFVAYNTDVKIEVITDERCYLRYSLIDQSYETMPNKFDKGQGSKKHAVTIAGEHGNNYLYYLRAEDIYGNQMDTSAAISFKIDTTKAPLNWFEIKYNLDLWKQGTAPFGFPDNSEITSQIEEVKTAYFKKDFYIVNVDSITYLTIILKFDNGAVVYLNGEEIERINMPVTEISYDSWAFYDVNRMKAFLLDQEALSLLNNGKNEIAVEVHQSQIDSTDLIFDLVLMNPDPLITFASDWYYYDGGKQPQIQIIDKVTHVAKSEQNRSAANFQLCQNYPNPFNSETKIEYIIRSKTKIKLIIYDILGRKIRTLVDSKKAPGVHYSFWDSKDENAQNVSSGIYVYQLITDGTIEIKKLIVLK